MESVLGQTACQLTSYFFLSPFFNVDFTDQINRQVSLPSWPPRRIISLVPSQTELLFSLGLEEAVVGITKFCVHPPAWFTAKQRVGGTKTLNIQKIRALKPDLILGNKEENDRFQIESLMDEFPVWMSDIENLEDALNMIQAVGNLTDRRVQAAALAADIRHRFQVLFESSKPVALTAAYLIWRKPYMAVGRQTFIHDLLGRAGFTNVFGHLQRYPEVDLAALAAARPQVILLSSEPYPFAEKHVQELAVACPEAKILLVDGELFSWYGSRLQLASAYFQHLMVMASQRD